ncbi:MAG: hypothetical protein FJX76_14385 [Armatimonadetes bacterium]|nr:hypothetical protein [Armatimonadota bacterium]
MIVEARGDVISLSGSLTENHWLTLKAACNMMLKRHSEGIIVDCGALTHCTPEGAHTFRDAVTFIEGHHARIILVNMPPEILDTLQSVPGVRSCIATCKSLDEARASLRLGSWTRGPAEKSSAVVMLPILGGGDPRTAIHHAVNVARDREAKLYLVYVLEVPRALALNAPLGEQEKIAVASMNNAEALTRREGITPALYLHRGRDVSEGLIEAAQKLKADVIVLGIPTSGTSERSLSHVVDTLLRRAPCEVIIDRPPQQPGNSGETKRLA